MDVSKVTFESIYKYTVAKFRRSQWTNQNVGLFYYNKEYTFLVYPHLDLWHSNLIL